jgi:hypothetical protein
MLRGLRRVFKKGGEARLPLKSVLPPLKEAMKTRSLVEIWFGCLCILRRDGGYTSDESDTSQVHAIVMQCKRVCRIAVNAFKLHAVPAHAAHCTERVY